MEILGENASEILQGIHIDNNSFILYMISKVQGIDK